jgi:hypothetical protein
MKVSTKSKTASKLTMNMNSAPSSNVAAALGQ